ncbi:MAG: 5-oxoprolinase subunit PxpB [Burkholderiaceae bacterium]|nr:5-oxoprolinase subunit PxpB [Burkholderiaceae bacterium]
MDELRVSMLGTAAMLCESMGPLSDDVQRRVWGVAGSISKWSHVTEVVPCMNNFMITFDPVALPASELEQRVRTAWVDTHAPPQPGRTIEIPVAYGGPRGVDLSDVAARTGLSIDEVVELHAGASYTVYALGSQPGAAYIAGLDRRLFIPRRIEPRVLVEGGAVCIAGAQTAVLVWAAPCGWHIIGHTTFRFFDVQRIPPALLSPGDRIRFTIQSVVR